MNKNAPTCRTTSVPPKIVRLGLEKGLQWGEQDEKGRYGDQSRTEGKAVCQVGKRAGRDSVLSCPECGRFYYLWATCHPTASDLSIWIKIGRTSYLVMERRRK